MDNKLLCTEGDWYINGPKINEEYGGQTYFSIQTKQPETRNGTWVMPGFYYPHSVQTPEEMESNAHLISASKYLYYALLALTEISGHASESHTFSKETEAAILALKKANPHYKP